MTGRLNVSIEGLKFFFSTRCEMESDGKEKGSVSFRESIDKTEGIATTLGFSPGKIFILRREYLTKEDELVFTGRETVSLLSKEAQISSRAVLEAGEYLLYLMAENMRIRISDSRIEAEVSCFIGLEDRKTDEYILHFECFAID